LPEKPLYISEGRILRIVSPYAFWTAIHGAILQVLSWADGQENEEGKEYTLQIRSLQSFMAAIGERERELKAITSKLLEPGPGSLRATLDVLRNFAIS